MSLSLTDEDLETATQDLIAYLGKVGGIGGEGILHGTAKVMLVGKLSKLISDKLFEDEKVNDHVKRVVDAFPRRRDHGRTGPPT